MGIRIKKYSISMAFSVALTLNVYAQDSFTLEKQSLEEAIKQIAKKSNMAYIADGKILKGKNSNAINEVEGVQEALKEALKNTGLKSIIKRKTILIIPKEKKLKKIEKKQQSKNENDLGKIEVIANNQDNLTANKKLSRKNSLGIIGEKDFMATPFNTVSYTSNYIEDLQAKDVSSIIGKTDPSVHTSGATGMTSEYYSIRGFSTGTYTASVNGLYGMVPYYRVSPEFIERVDVLKGPTALLNGMDPSGSVGGNVSIITKKANDLPTKNFAVTYDSDSLVGTSVDLGQRFGEKNQFGIRFNGAYRDGNTAINNQKATSKFAHLALDYRFDRGKVSAEYIYSYDNVNGVNGGIIGIPAGIDIPTPPQNNTLLAPKDTFSTTEDNIFILAGGYDITDNILAYVKYGHSKTDFDALSGSPYVINDQGDAQIQTHHQRNQYNKDSSDIGIRFNFDTFDINHELTTNATYYHHEQKFGFLRNMLGNNPWITNIYKLQYNGLYLDKSFSNTNIQKTAEVELSSYGVADSMSMFDDKLNIIMGVRKQNVIQESFDTTTGQRIRKYDESELTPALAIAYKFTDSVMTYANYIEGLSQGPTAPTSANNAGEMFKPMKTKQYEAGIKMDFMHFTNTLSIFQIEKPSGITDPITNIYSVDGEQRNRGIEYNFFGDISTDLRFIGGISYIQAKQTKTASGKNEGNYATATPKYQGKLRLEYDISNNLSINVNATAMSKQYINADNSLWVSGRTIYDVGGKYKMKIGSSPITFRADIKNVIDKDYWASGNLWEGLGAPRTFMFSAKLNF